MGQVRLSTLCGCQLSSFLQHLYGVGIVTPHFTEVNSSGGHEICPARLANRVQDATLNELRAHERRLPGTQRPDVLPSRVLQDP